MLKIAIVGCGKIADSHAFQIKRIKGCEIVAVCDNEELMAKQLYERFPVKSYYNDLNRLLDESKPDVVHITTPPQSHYVIAKKCMEKGCNLFIEKPFTINTEEAEELVEIANKTGCKLTVGHDAQFSDVSIRMRKLVKEGYLGGPPLHLESHWCYDFGDAVYAKALLSDKQHWARALPGKLLHNIINHGVSKIAEFIESDNPNIIAHGFISPFLKQVGENKIIDELRVIISEEKGTTAYFTFSSQIKPSLHQFRLYGSQNGLFLDEDKRLLIKLPGKNLKSYAEHFVPPISFARQYMANLCHSLKLFFASDFHFDAGKKYLFEAFYRAITDGTPVPIPYREIILTSRIMDTIFKQIGPQN